MPLDSPYQPTQSDHQLAAFLAGCDRRTVELDRFSHASPIEVAMLAHTIGDIP